MKRNSLLLMALFFSFSVCQMEESEDEEREEEEVVARILSAPESLVPGNASPS